jgi:hypothetical protein
MRAMQVDNVRWERIFNDRFADPTYYATMPRPGLCRVLLCEPRFMGIGTTETRHSFGFELGTLGE